MRKLSYIFLITVFLFLTFSANTLAYTESYESLLEDDPALEDEPVLEDESALEDEPVLEDEPKLEDKPALESKQNYEKLITSASLVTVVNEMELIAAVNDGVSVITLGADIYISSNLWIPANTDITLDGDFILSKSNIQGGNLIEVEPSARLTINGVHIKSPSTGANLLGIRVHDNAHLTLLDGSISGFIQGVYVTDGNFDMYGGIISDNNSTQAGGAVSIQNGQFVMYGGEISGNTAGYGGGVFITYGDFIMRSGIIYANTSFVGGGVHIEHSNFEMHDGIISDNKALEGGGGGVFVRESDFVMYNGEISRNSVSFPDWLTQHALGGGVMVQFSNFEMHDGVISENSAGKGGGIIVDFANFEMFDGVIRDNVSIHEGGGVIVQSSGSFVMQDGEISGNSAEIGGGIAVYYEETTDPSSFNMHGGVINGNDAQQLGGGISIENGSFEMLGGEISDNTAEFSGGGVAVSVDSEFTMHGGVISGNDATERGGGIYLTDTSKLNVTNISSIINNSAQSGGGIFTESVVDYNNLNAADYQNITTANSVIFSGNSAANAYEPPINADINYPNIKYASSSIQVSGKYWNPINNFDINYTGTTPIYFIHYFANGGTGAYEDVGARNSVYTVLSNTTTGINRTNHEFTEWNTNPNGNSTPHAAGDEITITSDLMLYAQWEYVPYNNGSGNDNTNDNRDNNILPAPDSEVSYEQRARSSINMQRIGRIEEGPLIGRPLPITAPPAINLELRRASYVTGYPDGTSRPFGHITRAEMLQLFFNLSQDPNKHAPLPPTAFTDLTSGTWYFNAVRYFENIGIINGFPDGTVRPDSAITIAEFVTVAVQFFSLGESLTIDQIMNEEQHWAASYINLALSDDWLRYFGILENFDPDVPIPRIQSISLVNFYLGRTPNPDAIHRYLQDRPVYLDIHPGTWIFYEMIEASLSRYYMVNEQGDEHWTRTLGELDLIRDRWID